MVEGVKFMKANLTFILVSLVGIFLFGCVELQPTARSTYPGYGGPTIDQVQREHYMGPKARVAVTRFEDRSAKGKSTGEIGDGMAEMLSNALFATNRFIVLERQALGDVIGEGDLGASGRVRRETAPRIGKIEGADLLISGTITEFEPGSEGAGGGLGVRWPGRVYTGIGGGATTSHVAMIIKVIDAETSRVLASEQVEGKATDVGGEIGGAGYRLAAVFGMYSKTPMEKAIRIAIEEAVRLIVAKTPTNYYRYTPGQRTQESTSPTQKPPQKTTSTQKPSSVAGPTVSSQPDKITQVVVPNAKLQDVPDGKIVGTASKGTSFVIVEEKEKWLHIYLEDGRKAWILKASTSKGTKGSSTPAAPPPITNTKSISPM